MYMYMNTVHCTVFLYMKATVGSAAKNTHLKHIHVHVLYMYVQHTVHVHV